MCIYGCFYLLGFYYLFICIYYKFVDTCICIINIFFNKILRVKEIIFFLERNEFIRGTNLRNCFYLLFYSVLII